MIIFEVMVVLDLLSKYLNIKLMLKLKFTQHVSAKCRSENVKSASLFLCNVLYDSKKS